MPLLDELDMERDEEPYEGLGTGVRRRFSTDDLWRDTEDVSIGARFLNAGKQFLRGVADVPIGFLSSVSIMAKRLDDLFDDEERTTHRLTSMGITAQREGATSADQYWSGQLAEIIRSKADDWFAGDERLAGRFLDDALPRTLGSLASMIGGGVALRAPKAFSMLSGMGMQASQAYDEALSRGASEDQAFIRFLLGAGLGTTEAIPIGRMLGRIDQGTGGMFRRSMVEAARNGMEEAVQEAIQTIGGNLATMAVYDRDQEWLEGWSDAAALGGTAGAMVGFGTTLILGRSARLQQQQAERRAAKLTAAIPESRIGPPMEILSHNFEDTTESDSRSGSIVEPDPTNAAPQPEESRSKEVTIEAGSESETEVPTTLPETELAQTSPDETSVQEDSSRLEPTDDGIDALEQFGLNKRHTQLLREGYEMDALPVPQRRAHAVAMSEAINRGLHKDALYRAELILASPGVVTDVEYAGMVVRAAELTVDYENSIRDANALRREGRAAEAEEAINRSIGIRNALDKIMKADSVAATELGRAMSIRRMQINALKFDAGSLLMEAEANKRATLNPEEQQKILAIADAIKEKEARIRELEENADRMLEERAAQRAQAEVELAWRSEVKLEEILGERERLKRELRGLGLRMNDISGLSAEAIWKLGKLAINFAKETKADLATVVSHMQGLNPDLDARDVYQAILAQNPNAKKSAALTAAQFVRSLKKEARLMKQIEDLTQTVATGKVAKADAPRSRAIEPENIVQLRKQVRELRKVANKTVGDPEKYAQTMKKIDDLQNILTVPTPDATTLQEAQNILADLNALRRARDEIADLDQQLATGEFKQKPKREPREKLPELDQARIQLQALRRDARRAVDDMVPFRRKQFREIGQGPVQATVSMMKAQYPHYLTLPRTMMATGDMSYMLRQGLWLSVRRPVVAGRVAKQAFNAFISTHSAEKTDFYLRGGGSRAVLQAHLLRLRSGLFLAPLDAHSSPAEELFASRIAQRIPMFGVLVRASERNMVTGLNLLRAAVFDDFAARNPHATDAELKAMADYVNVASGRGHLTPGAAQTLSTVLFAPRFAFSRFQTPQRLIKHWEHPAVRKEIAKDMTAFVSMGLSVLGMAAAAGVTVGLDPRDSDFGKMIFGNTRVDIWGGFMQPASLIAKIITGVTDRQEWTGEDLPDISKQFNIYDLVSRFSIYKLSPTVTVPIDLAQGKNVIGEEVEWKETLGRSVVPLMFQEIYDAARVEGVVGGVLTGAGVGLGVNVGTHQQPLRHGQLRQYFRQTGYFPRDPHRPDWLRVDDPDITREEKRRREDQWKEIVETYEHGLAEEILFETGTLDNISDRHEKKAYLQSVVEGYRARFHQEAGIQVGRRRRGLGSLRGL